MSTQNETRYVFLDTETTGDNPRAGDRVIEVGCVEMIGRTLTGRTLQFYLNPEGRKSDPGAFAVHGISDEFLLDKPTFKQVANQLVEFLRGSTVLIHNKDFDVSFLNQEFKRIDRPGLWDFCTVECTFQLAHSFFPGQSNSLKSLCKRLEVDDSKRELHGALIDCQILAEVFLKMTNDATPFVDDEALAKKKRAPIQRLGTLKEDRKPALVPLSAQQEQEHRSYLMGLEKENKSPPVGVRYFQEEESAPAISKAFRLG